MATRRHLRPADALLAPAVASAVKALSVDDVDAAAVRLAEQYAAAIDAGSCAECNAKTSIAELGPKLLACLVELGATPRARASVMKGGASGGGNLARLRSARSS